MKNAQKPHSNRLNSIYNEVVISVLQKKERAYSCTKFNESV
jgi:hypothetical protein